MKTLLKILLLSLLLTSCAQEEEESIAAPVDHEAIENKKLDKALTSIFEGMGGMSSFVLPDSDDFANIPQDPKNPLNKHKVELGKNLFHETAIALSPKNPNLKFTYSCASCHHVDAGFSSGNAQGIGEGGIGDGIHRVANPLIEDSQLDIQHIKSPTALNVAFQENVLWNGQFGATKHNEGLDHLFTPGTPLETNTLGFQGTETQAIAGLGVHGQIKQDSDLDGSWIKTNFEYSELFKKAFALPEDKVISKKTAGLAIAAFERTILANQAPFQDYLKGNKNALSIKEKRGAILFFGKANCVQCHSGPALSDNNFHAIGFEDIDTNPDAIITNPDFTEVLGRASFTGDAEDNFKFKTPTLYNLKDHATLGHGSSFNSIKEVITYKNDINVQNSMLNFTDLSYFQHKLYLSDSEIDDLSHFVEKSLYDSNLERYVPEETISKLPFPNNDRGIDIQ